MGLTGNQTLSPVGPSLRKNEDTSLHAGYVRSADSAQILATDSPPQQDYLSIVARATNDAVRDWNVSSGSLAWNPGLGSLLGYDPATIRSEISFWEENLHPGDRSRIAASLRECLSGSATTWIGEYRFRRCDGTYAQILERSGIVRDAGGKALRLVGSLMDITARKQLQDQLCRSQKMDAFGQLAGGVAHDFNNFLTTILGYSELVLSETGEKGAVASHVNEIRKAAGRASALAAQLLAFSRKQALEPHVVEINSLINNLERSLLRLLGDNINVVCQLHQDRKGAHIKVDPGQLTQIIVNLAVNARDAMPDGGSLTLETATVELGAEKTLSGLDELGRGEYVVISVVDNGVGMTEEVKAHLFEPFFTTKDDGRSSGLGLATSYGIVCQSGGRMRIMSEPGKGTSAQIYLPRVSAPPAAAYKKPGSKLLPTGSETVMVLEDEVSVRHISVRILRGLGYEVIEAATVDDAKRLFAMRNRGDIHLLLTDMVMPQMSGRDFANWLRKASPDTRVVFVSGYLEESLHPGDRVENGMFFLPKPFDPEQLATTIRQALDD